MYVRCTCHILRVEVRGQLREACSLLLPLLEHQGELNSDFTCWGFARACQGFFFNKKGIQGIYLWYTHIQCYAIENTNLPIINSIASFLFFFLFWNRISISCILDWPGAYYVANDLELLVFRPLPLKCWSHRHELPCLVYEVLGSTQGFLYARQALYQLSYIPSPEAYIWNSFGFLILCVSQRRSLLVFEFLVFDFSRQCFSV